MGIPRHLNIGSHCLYTETYRYHMSMGRKRAARELSKTPGENQPCWGWVCHYLRVDPIASTSGKFRQKRRETKFMNSVMQGNDTRLNGNSLHVKLEISNKCAHGQDLVSRQILGIRLWLWVTMRGVLLYHSVFSAGPFNNSLTHFLWNWTIGSASRSVTLNFLSFSMTSGYLETSSHPLWEEQQPRWALWGSESVSEYLRWTQRSLSHSKMSFHRLKTVPEWSDNMPFWKVPAFLPCSTCSLLSLHVVRVPHV